MKREENWNHVNVKRCKEMYQSYETKIMRMSRNLGTGLDSIQHTALMVLCKYRHKLHAVENKYGSIAEDERNDIRSFYLNNVDTLLRTANLPSLTVRFFSVDMIQDENQRSLYINEINAQIEDYLSAIDRKYGTMYCPTGIRRTNRDQVDDVMAM